MSAEHDTPDAPLACDDRRTIPADADPHGILPPDFLDTWNADSVAEALARAEDAPSTTPASEMARCPRCQSTRIPVKPGHDEMPHKHDSRHKCVTCDHHFDEPLPPLATAQRRADHAPTADREADAPRCRECLSTELYPVPETVSAADARWICLECGATFDVALPSERAEKCGDVAASALRRIQALRRDDGQAGLDEVMRRD